MDGRIIKVLSDKRFGFIKGDDGTEYFFHQSDLNGFFDDLAADVAIGRTIFVTFQIVPSLKGPRAGNIFRKDAGV